jgi:hypothetical protein
VTRSHRQKLIEAFAHRLGVKWLPVTTHDARDHCMLHVFGVPLHYDITDPDQAAPSHVASPDVIAVPLQLPGGQDAIEIMYEWVAKFDAHGFGSWSFKGQLPFIRRSR